MRLISVLICFSILFSFQIQGNDKDKLKQIGQIRVTSLDTVKGYTHEFVEPDENLNDLFEEKMDSLTQTWYVQNLFLNDQVEIDTNFSVGKILPDSVYIERLKKIDTPIDLSYNKVVKNFISMYSVKRREQVEIMLGLSAYYFPIFEEILDKYDMPMELKYLPIIESALNPKARSWAGASGLWQFVYGTGKMMKLDVNSFVDERRDELKSSEAAAKYLKQLYDVYQDWHLVIAAYNCGPGNVNKAIRRSGGKRDYWSIYYRLPRETRGYVPAFIAATYIMTYYKEHNLMPILPEIPLMTDTLMVQDYLNLKQVAKTLDIELEQLRELNPMYRADVIPARPEKPYPIRIPVEYVGDFIDQETTIFNHEREKYFPDNSLLKPASASTAYYTPIDIKGKEKLYYKVKSGDNIGYISSWYNVRASDIRYWNNIRRNLIRVGQKLLIYVPKDKKEQLAKVDGMSFEAKQWMIGKTPGSTTKKEPTVIDPNYEYYTVRRGDNLWDIASKYDGISNKDLMQLNNIKDVKSLYIGQKLKVRKKS